MRLLRGVLITVATLLGLSTLTLAPAHAAAWVVHDTQCTTTGSGLACVRIDKVIGQDTYRARTEVTPVVGKWIRPDSYSIAIPNAGGGGPLCDGGACGKKTSRWVSAWQSMRGDQVYTGVVKSASGTHSVTAGDTGWHDWKSPVCRSHTAGKACVQPQLRIKDGKNLYRAHLTLAPAKGEQMTPRSVTVAIDPASGYEATSKTRSMCLGDLCLPWSTDYSADAQVRFEGIYDEVTAKAEYAVGGTVHRLTA